MVEKNRLSKAFTIIRRNRFLRIISALNVIIIMGVLALCFTNFSYKEKIIANINEIETNKQLAQSLESVLQNAEIGQAEESVLTKKSFAKYEEVIPFVAILENLFYAIDQESEISIKSKEDEIYVNHYADYRVNLNINNGNKPLFFQIFDELYNSKFIAEITDFSVNYIPENEDSLSELNRADINIRLYLD